MKCLQCKRPIKNMFKFCSDRCETIFFNENKFECFINGNCICIVAKGFKNLQENDAVFVGVTPNQIEEVKDLIKRPKKKR